MRSYVKRHRRTYKAVRVDNPDHLRGVHRDIHVYDRAVRLVKPEGSCIVTKGEWIVLESNGNMYSMSNAMFMETFVAD